MSNETEPEPGDRNPASAAVTKRTTISATGWSLTVADDGVGADPTSSRAGLGTGIIEALAKQLDAIFTLESAKPGTKAEISHG